MRLCRSFALLSPLMCLGLLWHGPSRLSAQSINAPLQASWEGDNIVIKWNGRGTLQSAGAITGNWEVVLEAPNPFKVSRTDQPRAGFFRVVSHWSTRANLLEANSEMAVAEPMNRQVGCVCLSAASRCITAAAR